MEKLDSICDISRLKAHEPDLSVREQRLAMDQLAEGVLALEGGPLAPPGPRIVWANQGLLVQTGWTREELAGRPLAALLPPEVLRDFLRRLARVAGSPRRYHVDLPMLAADGSPVASRWFIRRGPEETGQGAKYLVGVRSVTPQPAPQAVLAGGLAHDFNNALAGLLSHLSVAASEPAGRNLRVLLENAQVACESARGFAGRLVSVACGQSHRRAEHLPVEAETRAAMRLADVMPGIQWSLAVEAGLPEVEADAVHLRQILGNLLINARQATAPGGSIELAVRHRQHGANSLPGLAAGDYIEWRVRDHGSGIPESLVPRVFDAFFTTRANGTGLGLATSLALARGNGGSLSVQSRAGAGCDFFLWLPCACPTFPGGVRGKSARCAGRRLSLLIADDHPAVREALGGQFQHLGHTVQLADSGQEAVDAFQEAHAAGRPPDIVILDLQFRRGISGDVAARAIAAIDPGALLVAWSGAVARSEAPPAAAFTAVLPKPFGPDDVLRLIALGDSPRGAAR